jgi:hypothetical protein
MPDDLYTGCRFGVSPDGAETGMSDRQATMDGAVPGD